MIFISTADSGASMKKVFGEVFGKVLARDLDLDARYQILEHLATGGMAEVYKAKLIQPNGFSKIVVIKKITGRYESDLRWTDSFLREAKIMSLLNHSNIAHVYHTANTGSVEKGGYFIVMEFVDGGTLYDLKKGAKKIPLEFVYYTALETLKGLSYAHKKGVLHRDVSLSNILISREGEIKISDFGIAQLKDRSEATQGLKGKLDYMSPEQKQGRQLTESSDLYSLALVLYGLITGEKYGSDPCAGAGHYSTLKKALADVPEGRFQTAELFEEALRNEWGAMVPQISQRDFSRFLSNHPPWSQSGERTETLSFVSSVIQPSIQSQATVWARRKLFLFLVGLLFVPLGFRSADFSPHGFLSLNIRPWADVYFENKTHLGMTPIIRQMMATGKYRLMCVNREIQKKKMVTVEIRANEVLKLTLEF